MVYRRSVEITILRFIAVGGRKNRGLWRQGVVNNVNEVMQASGLACFTVLRGGKTLIEWGGYEGSSVFFALPLLSVD